LALPNRIDNWSLTSLQQRLVKTGGRLIKHARYYWLLLAGSHLTRRLFGAMVQFVHQHLRDVTGGFCTIDKDEGDVKSIHLPRAARSNSREPRVWRPKLFASHRGIISVEDLPPTIDSAIKFGHDSSIQTPSLCRVRERLFRRTVWLGRPWYKAGCSRCENIRIRPLGT